MLNIYIYFIHEINIGVKSLRYITKINYEVRYITKINYDVVNQRPASRPIKTFKLDRARDCIVNFPIRSRLRINSKSIINFWVLTTTYKTYGDELIIYNLYCN